MTRADKALLGDTDDQILSNGYASCRILRTTDADTNAVAAIAAPRIGLSYSFAIWEVDSAVRWLCPDQICTRLGSTNESPGGRRRTQPASGF
jgi:hypothetical protein